MNKKKLCDVTNIFFFLFIFYGIFLFFFKMHLVSDAYRIIYSNTDYIVNLKMVEGRPLQALYFKLINYIVGNINTISKYFAVYKIGLVLSGFIFAVTFALVYKNTKKIIGDLNRQKLSFIFILEICIFINVTVCEYMLFIENIVMALGVLFAVIAVLIFDIKNKGACKYILCYIFLVLSAFCYQGTTQIFVVLSFLNFILRSVNIFYTQTTKIEKKQYIIALIKIFGLYFSAQGVSYLICVAYNKIYPTMDPRLATGIVKNLKNLVSNNVVSVYKAIFFIFSIIIFYNIIKPEDKNNKSNFRNMTVLLITGFIAFIIFTFNNSAGLVPRTIYNLVVMFPILEIYILNLKYKKISKSNICIICMYFVANVVLVVYLQHLNLISTKQNIDAVNEIIYRINEYEKKNNIMVEEIAFYKDESPNYEYWNATLNFVSTYTNPVYYGYWCDIYSINVLSGRNFRKVSKDNLDKDVTCYFKNKDWDKLNLEEQMVFESNRVSICKF